MPHDRPSNRFEILIGRSAALCAHPYAAWRMYSTRERIVVFLGYLVAGYAVALIALLVG